jgi:hypothetical protein
MTITVRSFHNGQPLPGLDVRTGSNRVAAEEAAARAARYGTWDDVQLNFSDGSRPMRGDELRRWVERHFPLRRSQPRTHSFHPLDPSRPGMFDPTAS